MKKKMMTRAVVVSLSIAMGASGSLSALAAAGSSDHTGTTIVEDSTVGSEETDASKAPALVLTELLPDSSNLNGADAYEFVELYNNSDKDINLKDYKLCYNYPDTGSDAVWWETDEDKILPAGGTLVFWVKNGGNDSLTKEDFNKKFNTSLDEEQLIELSCGGMANSGARGVKICTNVNDIVDFVLYNENGADDTTKDQTITFQNQYTDGSFHTVMTSNKAVPTPGIITDQEKPHKQAELTAPEKAPVLEDKTPESYTNSTESLEFALKASSEETTVKTVKLYTKYQGESEYEVYNLKRQDGDSFKKVLNNIDLLNKKSYTYYFVVSDGFQTVKTEEKTIRNEDAVGNTAFNLRDGETVSGETQVIAYGDKLLLDDQDVSAEAEKSINGPGKIVFEASQTDVFFKNAVAVDGDTVGIFNEGTYDAWRTYIYDINASHFDYDTKTVTVEFHAGNKANALEHNIENNDDFVLKNIRMILPSGKTLYPGNYQAKMGLGAVEHENMDAVPMKDLGTLSQEKEISMGDGTSKNEILYATFTLSEEDFDALRYQWKTDSVKDGEHKISGGNDSVSVTVDNTAPVITTNLEDGKDYHGGTIEVSAEDALSKNVKVTAQLDGENIEVPYEFSSLTMTPGNHELSVTAEDEVGNIAEKKVGFTTPKESAEITGDILPGNGETVTGDPTLSVTAEDPSGDTMRVTFKKGEHYQLGDSHISAAKGVSSTAGTASDSFEAESGNGFPYECFDIAVDGNTAENDSVEVKWEGSSNNGKTFLYVYNTATGQWEQTDAVQTLDGETMTLTGEISVKDHVEGGVVKVMVQNGEGYTPVQYGEGVEAASVTTSNADDTKRSDYDFTFAVESDTQYYNEDYEGNPDQSVDGSYQYQLDIHDWILANRERMNIQYLFHDGDIIDDEPNTKEWEQADAAYKKLDEAGFAYGILAGNHDVGHLAGDYSNYSNYFGESRFAQNPWYGGSYKDNRAHYDLITVNGIDFLMMYTGWGIGDEEIAWMNDVLAKYPERKAILNFHEYLLASGGLGEEPQRVHDEVVAKNDNVCMVFSGHYHNAYTKEETFAKADGSERKVYSLLFDYQGLPEGGLGYMRLLHFDVDGGKLQVRTYSPAKDDYDAKTSAVPNEGNDYVVPGADSSINGEETFEISFADLGITPKVKTLETKSLDVDVYGDQVIGSVDSVKSGEKASLTWENAPAGVNGWYAEVTDENGGLTRTPVRYVNVEKETLLPFVDVEGHWGFDAVKYVYERKIMTGIEETLFGPDDNLARAQFAVILHRMEGAGEEEYADIFPDVEKDSWFTDAVLWANKSGIITGYGQAAGDRAGFFGPADKINREQMAVMMYRYAQYKGYDTDAQADLSRYEDAGKVNDFAKEALTWAIGNGIITGKYNQTILDPQGSATRAECAVIIQRFEERYGK